MPKYQIIWLPWRKGQPQADSTTHHSTVDAPTWHEAEAALIAQEQAKDASLATCKIKVTRKIGA